MISGSSGTVKGATSLANSKNRHQGQTWIEGGTIVGIDNKNGTDVSFWRYPAGGNPQQTMKKVNLNLLGVTISPAKQQ
jgi:hypothetical protein